MSLSVYHESFVNPTSAGTDSSLAVGFSPVAALVLGTLHLGAGHGSGVSAGLGMAIAQTNQRVAQVHQEFVAMGGGTVRARATNDDASIVRTPSEASPTTRTALIKASPDGWANPLVIDWTNVSGSQYYHHALVLGGSGVQAACGAITLPAAGTSSGYTGLGFRPDVVLFEINIATGTYPFTTSTANSSWGIGWGTALAQGCASVRLSDNATPTDCARRQATDAVIWIGTGASDLAKVDLVSLDSDGFTLHTTTAGAQYAVRYLALAGVGAVCGALTQPTAGGAQTQQVATPGVTPQAVLLMSNGLPAGSGLTQDAVWSFGWATSDAARVAVCLMANDDEDTATEDHQAVSYLSLSQVLQARDTPVGTSSTARAAADLAAFGSESFSLDWESIDATARQVLFLALGDPVAHLPPARMPVLGSPRRGSAQSPSRQYK